MTTTSEDLVAKLQAHLAALGDGHDLTSDNEKARWRDAYAETSRTISGLMNEQTDLEKPQRLLADLEARRQIVLETQASIEQQIADAPDWRTVGDRRAQDTEYDRQQQLARQLQLLRAGNLLIAPGVAAERLSDLDVRIEELQTRIELLRARLASHRQAAEALLGVAVTDDVTEPGAQAHT